MKFLRRLETWVSNATVADIVCHTDSDGLTAAAQLALYLKSKGVGYNVVLGSPERLRHANFWKAIKNDLVFFVDIPADQEWEELVKLNNKANIVIIDHHTITKDMNRDSIIHYHRELLEEERYYPASKMVYDILGGVDWMACIGIIGDYGGKPWNEFINQVHEKYGFKSCADENCFDSPFAKYDQLINSARMIKGDKGCLKALSVLVEASNWEDFKDKSEVLEDWAKKVDEYIQFMKEDYKSKREVHKNLELVFYELKDPKYKIGSTLSVIISTEEPNKTIIIITSKDGTANINLRRQDGKYDMSELSKSCAKSVKGSGGGHKKASGATIDYQFINEFKECVKKTLSNWVKNPD